MNPPTEFELLLCLARVSLRASDEARARAILGRGGFDWELFHSLAWRHGLMPLAFRHLLERFAAHVPEAHLARAREDFRHNSARNLLLASELRGVLDALAAEGVAAVAYKGPALAVQVYGDLKLRSFVDLDVLVRRADAERAGRVLASVGYRPHLSLTPAQEAMLARSECDRVYFKEGRGVMLELHWAVAPPYFSLALETEDVLDGATRVELCGREVVTPSAEMLLLLLCVNGAKDLWRALEPLCAVAELSRARGGVDWPRVVRLARRAGALRMLFVGLLLARDLLDAPLPAEVARLADSDRAARRLAGEASRRLAERETRAPGLAEETRFRVAARERLRERARYCALRLLTPTYRDCSFELPPALRFVYYVLRPLRLLGGVLKRPASKPVL
ncbi:MAG TPA: nucleotidyltransferase family protein [Pyrinomonadaceae bacterium]